MKVDFRKVEKKIVPRKLSRKKRGIPQILQHIKRKDRKISTEPLALMRLDRKTPQELIQELHLGETRLCQASILAHASGGRFSTPLPGLC